MSAPLTPPTPDNPLGEGVMVNLDAADAAMPIAQLTEGQIKDILSRPNGSFVLIEMVRSGRVDPEIAVTAIDQVEAEPFLKRVFLALLDALCRK